MLEEEHEATLSSCAAKVVAKDKTLYGLGRSCLLIRPTTKLKYIE